MTPCQAFQRCPPHRPHWGPLGEGGDLPRRKTLPCRPSSITHPEDASETVSCVCVFITAVPNAKLCAWGEEDSGGHVL
jgi:hypothetical protein